MPAARTTQGTWLTPSWRTRVTVGEAGPELDSDDDLILSLVAVGTALAGIIDKAATHSPDGERYVDVIVDRLALEMTMHAAAEDAEKADS